MYTYLEKFQVMVLTKIPVWSVFNIFSKRLFKFSQNGDTGFSSKFQD